MEEGIVNISVMINGMLNNVPEGTSLLTLLKRLDIDPGRVAVEYNMEIVNKSNFNDTVLKDNDTLEIITFVGGGV
ncbi:MAG TPA: sulfur carrier protein ThiS [Nitrospirota bacterium]|nr:sulfur carrier protein ThiS [Nitrospirota bacterium]